MHLISNHDAVTLMTFKKGNRLWYRWFGEDSTAEIYTMLSNCLNKEKSKHYG